MGQLCGSLRVLRPPTFLNDVLFGVCALCTVQAFLKISFLNLVIWRVSPHDVELYLLYAV
jgi:hypothetical protein